MLRTLHQQAARVEHFRTIATSSMVWKEKKTTRSMEMGDDGLPKDYKLKTLRTGSRRLDTFVNRACGKSSSEVTKLILQGKVRVNDEVYTKKAYNVCQNDVIEVWMQAFADNTALAKVDRTERVSYEVTEQGYSIEVKSWKNFLSDNWRSSQ